jgi:hypothetical protein
MNITALDMQGQWVLLLLEQACCAGGAAEEECCCRARGDAGREQAWSLPGGVLGGRNKVTGVVSIFHSMRSEAV